uniref:Uncharacterized protein n=1 Tax=Steinernema glaseri TaxID=37863 RepID=A0A1I7YYF1_9BILA
MRTFLLRTMVCVLVNHLYDIDCGAFNSYHHNSDLRLPLLEYYIAKSERLQRRDWTCQRIAEIVHVAEE